MEALQSALREGCAGQLPEIYDGADHVLDTMDLGRVRAILMDE